MQLNNLILDFAKSRSASYYKFYDWLNGKTQSQWEMIFFKGEMHC